MLAFADTSYYVALLQRTDSLHARALQITDSFRGRIVTTAWVLTELGNYFSHGIAEALTADRHFEQAGFNIILK